MRTTVTLDPDLATHIRRVAGERGISFKAALNLMLRAGVEKASGSSTPYREVVRPLGIRPGVDLTKALRLADELEDEENIRQLELRK